MAYPYPELTKLLQFRCVSHEYQQITTPFILQDGTLQNPPKSHLYWQILPEYTVAECPICGYRVQSLADTYSLIGWSGSPLALLQSLYRSNIPAITESHVSQGTPKFAHCAHFLGIHRFLNLHEIPPPNTYFWPNRTGEVPYVTPWFFPDDIPTYAVLHALPICRIEGDTFVPTYTVFSLTYFSQDRQEILERWREQSRRKRLHDPEYYPTLLATPYSYSDQAHRTARYDLSTWAYRGKLGFLDITQLDLPLSIGKSMELPKIYRNIQGRLTKYIWSRGWLRSF